jgi:hypothetical protein
MRTSRLVFASLGLLVIGFACGYALRGTGMSLPLYHVGGLGALGLLACGAGAIALKKGRGFWWGFLPALSLSILLGLIAAYLVPPTGLESRPAACGGSVSLLVALVVIAFWGLKKGRSPASMA